MGIFLFMNVMILNALAEPSRMRIVEYLRDEPRSVGEISTKLKIRQPQVSKHLRVLTESGWVEVRPLAQQRIYQLQAKHFQELDKWLESFKKLWMRRYEQLDGLLEELKLEEKTKKQNKKSENKNAKK
ncbi:MAG: winged helix-turn-helix transcriptional regulator [Leptospiraceae bacterium]|nr:winged helix-turn-helix transcriptional regulator [Leptospiraceae bacterium]